MTQEHPITPPPELVEQWAHLPADWNTVASLIVQWGADAELEACCEWLDQKVLLLHQSDVVPALRAARRPKPPSLKEQALQALAEADADLTELEWPQCSDTIRRALEQLPDNN
jgi:hypothetical protein